MATASVKNLYTGTTSAVLYTDRRDFYYKPETFAELYKEVTPFLSLAMRNRVSGLKDPVFKMFTHENPWQRKYMYNNSSTVTIAAAGTGAAAESNAVTFDNITGMNSDIDTSYVHQIFEVWDSAGTTKRGVVLLTDDTSSTTAKFRNLGTTAIATVDNDIFVNISNAQEDGSEAPDAWSDELSVVWNQCAQIKTSIEIKGDLYYASLRGANNELARLRAQKLQDHKMSIEGALMKSKSPLGTNLGGSSTFTDLDKLVGDNSAVVRTTYGIIPAIEDYGSSSGANQNIFNITEASYKYANYVEDMEKVFQFVPSSGEKYGIAGPGMMSYWSKLDGTAGIAGKSSWRVQISGSQKDSLGFNIRKLETPHGVINLLKSFSLKHEYNKHMVVPDDRFIQYMEFRPTKFQANIKTDNAYDGEKDLYFSEPGLGLTHIKAHSLWKVV